MEAAQGQKKKLKCMHLIVGTFMSIMVPCSQLVPVQPSADGAGHSHDVG